MIALLKNLYLILGGVLAWSFCSQAQTFEQLKPTTCPAIMILGVSPTDIERPTTPKEFATAIQAGLVNGKLAPNLAMEFSPFELLSGERKASYIDKAQKYLMNDSYGMNLARSVSVSVATSESDTIALGTLGRGTSTSLGVKFLLANGRLKSSTQKALLEMRQSFDVNMVGIRLLDPFDDGDSLSEKDVLDRLAALETLQLAGIESSLTLNEEDKQAHITVVKAQFQAVKKKVLAAFPRKTKLTGSQVKAILKPGIDALDAKIRQNLTSVNSKFAFAREGFMLEVNAAFVGHFVGNSWDSLQAAKSAYWLTPSWRWRLDENHFGDVVLLDLMGLVRYTNNNVRVDTAGYLDMGAKLQFTFNKLTMSAEYVGRIVPGYENASGDILYTDRITGSLEYVLNNLITLRASFGRTFDGNSAVYDDTSDGLFGMGGLALSFLNKQGL